LERTLNTKRKTPSKKRNPETIIEAMKEAKAASQLSGP